MLIKIANKDLNIVALFFPEGCSAHNNATPFSQNGLKTWRSRRAALRKVIGGVLALDVLKWRPQFKVLGKCLETKGVTGVRIEVICHTASFQRK